MLKLSGLKHYSIMFPEPKTITTETMEVDETNFTSSNTRGSDSIRVIETSKARNKEAFLTSGMGYGKRKRQSLAAFWSIVWPGLEKIGWKRVSDDSTITAPAISRIGIKPNIKYTYYPIFGCRIDSKLDSFVYSFSC